MMSWVCICGTVNDDTWLRCAGCREEIKEEDKIIDMDKKVDINVSYNNNVTPNKLEPTYGFNVRHRVRGLVFGI